VGSPSLDKRLRRFEYPPARGRPHPGLRPRVNSSAERWDVALQFADPLAARHQFGLEVGDLVAPGADQIELAIDVLVQLLEDLAPPTGSSTPACHSRRSAVRDSSASTSLQTFERDSEQALQPQQLSQPFDVGLGVGAVGAGLAASAASSRPISS